MIVGRYSDASTGHCGRMRGGANARAGKAGTGSMRHRERCRGTHPEDGAARGA